MDNTYKSLFAVDRTTHWSRGPGDVDVSHVNEEILALMNKVRVDSGIEPLKPHPALYQAAAAHAFDMADHNKLSHYGISVYSTWADRCAAAGYPGANLMTINENVGAGQTSAEMLMGDYRQSAGHWAAIMNPDARHTGSAACTGSSGWTYWCTDFGLGAPDVYRRFFVL